MPGERGGERRIELDIGDRPVTVRCRRSTRARRLSLRLSADGEGAILTAPRGLPWREAIAFLEDNRGWLRRRVAALPPRVPFSHGVELPLLGTPCALRHCPDQLVMIAYQGDELCVGGHRTQMADRVAAWLRGFARDTLGGACRSKAQQTGREVSRISVRDPHSRWGSCSSRGNITLSWRLILAPPAVTDYVIAHEVAHLTHLNHGPRFWRMVERLCPGHGSARDWLRTNGQALHRYG